MKKWLLLSAFALILSQTVGVIPAAFAEGSTTTTTNDTVVNSDQPAQTETQTDEQVDATTPDNGDQTAVDDSTTTETDGTTATTDNNDQTATDNTSADDSTTTVDGDTSKDDVSLVPGDFFYFVKMMIEKVHLALVTNDTEQAKLLAEYSKERINEANALLADGKTDLAAKTLQTAIDEQKEALATVSADDQSKATDENTDGTDSTDTTATTATTDKTTTTDVQAKDDIPKPLQAVFTQNIESLMNALAKVKNPKAQLALTKNIEKSFGKMAMKIDKHHKLIEKFANKDAAKDDENVETQPTTTVDQPTQDAQPAVEPTQDESDTQVAPSDQTVTVKAQSNVSVSKKAQPRTIVPVRDNDVVKTTTKTETEKTNEGQSHGNADHVNQSQANQSHADAANTHGNSGNHGQGQGNGDHGHE